MSSEKKVDFVEPESEDDDIVDLSEESEEDDEEIDLEDEDLELEDEQDGNLDMMSAFAGILQGTFHLPPDDEDDDEEETKNICEVLADISIGMEAIGKNMETQNKILLKILTQLSSKK